jgi:hypothetical protein
MKAAEMRNLNNLNQKKMKTLFERLKPETLVKLQEASEKYPAAIRSIVQELKINRFFIDLNYGTVISLSNFLHLKDYSLTEMYTQFEEHENLIN